MATAINMHHIHSTFCIRSPYSVQNGPRLCQRSLHCFKSCRSTKRPAHKLSASKHCYNPEARASAKTGKTSTQPLSPLGCRSRVQAVSNSDAQLKAAAALLVGLGLCMPDAAQAFNMHQEPDNALSFPTWVIHISSVIEWIVAMGLVWRYAEVTGNTKWKGLTWGMMPLLGGAICACTYHFFYNSPDLDILVAIQASLTWIGNATCAAAAFRIYQGAQQEGAS